MENMFLKHIFKNKLGVEIEGITLFTENGQVRSSKLDKLKIYSGINIIHSYGLLQNGESTSYTRIDDNDSSHLGFIGHNCILKLKDSHPLGYTSDINTGTNTAPGVKVWKGEVCVKGGGIMTKYFKDNELNYGLFDTFGF